MTSWHQELELQAGAQLAQIEQVLGIRPGPGYYGFEGQPLGGAEWAVLFDTDSRVLSQTEAHDGTWISTVWMGLDLGPEERDPLMFETMVFEDQEPTGEVHRWPTHVEAEAGHDEVVRQHGGEK